MGKPAAPESDEQRARAEWLDHVPLATGVVRDGKILYVNRAYEALCGMPRSELVGRSHEAQVDPTDRDRIHERHRMRMQGEPVPDTYESRLVRPSGEVRHVEVHVSKVGGDVIVQLQDITGRARRQQALREVARLGTALRAELGEDAIFEAAGRGLFAIGATAIRLVRVDDGVRVGGAWIDPGRLASIEHALGRPLAGMVRPWNPAMERTWTEGAVFLDDTALGMLRFFGSDRAQDLKQHSSAFPLTHGVMLRLDIHGQPREVLAILSPWIESDDLPALQLFGAQVCAALEAARVISDLSRRNADLIALNRVAIAAGTAPHLEDLFLRATEELCQLFKSDSVALFLIDRDGKHAELAYSMGGTAALRGRYARVPLAGSKVGEVAEAKKARVLRVEDYPPAARPFLREAGQVLAISAPLMVQSRVVGVVNVGFNRDREVAPEELDLVSALGVHLAAATEANRLVDDLRSSLRDLSDTQRQLVEQERLAAIGEMAAALAHEVRNPLGVIVNALEAFKRELAKDSSGRRLLDMAIEESERMNHLVDDLLVFSRPQKPDLSEQVDLEPLLRGAVELAMHEVAKAPDVDLRVGPGLGEVTLDQRLMRQAFLNVVLNGVQSMPKGGTLAIEAVRVGDEVEVSFRDSGTGISADVLPRIFEPFFTTRARGTGLGLALVKRIVEGHRGQIVVSSQLGVGTTVRIRWPIAARK